MSALRRCERCQTLNNTLVNGDHCYVCGQQWERDERAVVTDGGQCRECDSEYRCAYCGRDLDELDEVCRCGNAVGVLKR